MIRRVRALIARLLAELLFWYECRKYGVPGLAHRVCRARRAGFDRAILIDPSDVQAAVAAGIEAGHKVFVNEFYPAVERHRRSTGEVSVTGGRDRGLGCGQSRLRGA